MTSETILLPQYKQEWIIQQICDSNLFLQPFIDAYEEMMFAPGA